MPDAPDDVSTDRYALLVEIEKQPKGTTLVSLDGRVVLQVAMTYGGRRSYPAVTRVDMDEVAAFEQSEQPSTFLVGTGFYIRDDMISRTMVPIEVKRTGRVGGVRLSPTADLKAPGGRWAQLRSLVAAFWRSDTLPLVEASPDDISELIDVLRRGTVWGSDAP